MRFWFINAETGEIMLDVCEQDYIEAMKSFADEFRIDPEALIRKKELYLFQVYEEEAACLFHRLGLA